MAIGINIRIHSKVFKSNKKFSENHTAIGKLNLKISKGEFCSIIGPSGCGKTTLLNLIAGLDNDLKGKIIFDKKKKLKI